MTSATLHQIADLIGRISQLVLLLEAGGIGTDEAGQRLEQIRLELYRIAIESRGTAETLLEILEEEDGDSPDESESDSVH